MVSNINMPTKQDVIIAFSATVKNVLDTTKATVPLDDSDIIRNCNTSIYKAREHIRVSLSILDYHRRHKEVSDLVIDAEKVMRQVNFLYLQPYGEHFMRWSEKQLQKELAKDENYLDGLFSLQEMEKKYPYYNQMVETFKEIQQKYIDFSDKLQRNLNILEPSEFEKRKSESDGKKIKKHKIRQRLSSSCEDLRDLSSTSSDSIQFVPTTVSRSTTRHFAVKLGMISGGVSKTNSSESIASCSF